MKNSQKMDKIIMEMSTNPVLEMQNQVEFHKDTSCKKFRCMNNKYDYKNNILIKIGKPAINHRQNSSYSNLSNSMGIITEIGPKIAKEAAAAWIVITIVQENCIFNICVKIIKYLLKCVTC